MEGSGNQNRNGIVCGVYPSGYQTNQPNKRMKRDGYEDVQEVDPREGNGDNLSRKVRRETRQDPKNVCPAFLAYGAVTTEQKRQIQELQAIASTFGLKEQYRLRKFFEIHKEKNWDWNLANSEIRTTIQSFTNIFRDPVVEEEENVQVPELNASLYSWGLIPMSELTRAQSVMKEEMHDFHRLFLPKVETSDACTQTENEGHEQRYISYERSSNECE